MNLQLRPRTDAMLPHPHPVCALRDTHTLDPRLSSRSSDLITPNSGHQLPGRERSERDNTRSFPGPHQLNPIQRP
jgi:hypothetical protein